MAFIEYQEHFETFAAWREWREAWSPPWICQLDACKVWHPSSQSLTQWWESGVNTSKLQLWSSYSEIRTYENDFRQETNQKNIYPCSKRVLYLEVIARVSDCLCCYVIRLPGFATQRLIQVTFARERVKGSRYFVNIYTDYWGAINWLWVCF